MEYLIFGFGFGCVFNVFYALKTNNLHSLFGWIAAAAACFYISV